MERSITLFEAKAHFSGLVRDVIENQQEIIITKHGHPVVKLVPAEEKKIGDVRGAIERMKEFSRKMTNSGVSMADIKAWREEGR